jgi:hypothetical protein
VDAGDLLALYAAVVATLVAIVQWRRARPPIRIWFSVTEASALVVHATNTGRRPVSVDLVAAGGPPWRFRRAISELPPAAPGSPIAALLPGEDTQRILTRTDLAGHAAARRHWISVATAVGTARHRRIPRALTRHVLHGPPRRRTRPSS